MPLHPRRSAVQVALLVAAVAAPLPAQRADPRSAPGAALAATHRPRPGARVPGRPGATDPVPEPPSAALVAAGLGGLALAVRRGRRPR